MNIASLPATPHLLIVDDHKEVRDLLSRFLVQHNYQISVAGNGDEMSQRMNEESIDLVILDVMMPGKDGLTLCRELRVHSNIPVIMLTAMGEEVDKIIGLEMGADDYLAKPFEVDELLARLRVVERRSSSSKHAGLQIGDVELDTACYGLSVANEAVDISRREFTLLKALMENAGRVLTRESLESKLYSWNEEVASNTIEVHIHHLRKKLGTEVIETVRGVGYKVS